MLRYLHFTQFALYLSGLLLFTVACRQWQEKLPQQTSTPAHNLPFAQLPYQKIMAYSYNVGDMATLKERPIERIIGTNGQIAATAVLPPVQLSPEQATRLMKILTNRSHYGQGGAKCFIPRMGFVLYNKRDSLIGQANVCLECEWVRAEPPIPYQQEGLNAKGIAALSDMCRELGLKDCVVR